MDCSTVAPDQNEEWIEAPEFYDDLRDEEWDEEAHDEEWGNEKESWWEMGPKVASGTLGEAAMQGGGSVGCAGAGNEAMED